MKRTAKTLEAVHTHTHTHTHRICTGKDLLDSLERGASRGNLIYEKLNVRTHGLYVVFCMVAKAVESLLCVFLVYANNKLDLAIYFR